MESDAFCGVKIFKYLDPLKIHDFEYWVYVFTGCWEYKSPQRWKTILYKIYQSVMAFIYVISLTFYVIDAFAVKDDLEKLSFNMSSSFLVFVTLVKVIMLFQERNNLEDVNTKLRDHLQLKTIGVSEEDRGIFKKKAEILSTITIGFYTLLFLGLPLRVIADTTFEPRTYLIPIPQREMVEAYFAYIYFPQTVIIFHFLVVVLAHDLLIFSVLVRFIAHFEVLTKNFQKFNTLYPRTDFEKEVRGFVENEEQVFGEIPILRRSDFEQMGKFMDGADWIENDKFKEKRVHQLLKDNITHHQMLLRETKSFCRVYSLPLLVQSLGSGILIGIVILQIFLISKRMTTLLIEQIMFTATLLWNVFHLCSFATDLTNKSRMAANALYGIPWYEMDVKNRKIVQFAIKKLMEGPKLKGGNMVVINRVTYLKFLRVSYNLIAVLRHIY